MTERKPLDTGIKCEAAVHARSCVGYANTVDHFTPRSVAKLLRWKAWQINDPMNLIPMFRACHDIKDRKTALVKLQVKFQQKGGTIYFGKHVG